MSTTAGKSLFFLGFALILSALTTAAYLATARFLKDREAAVARLSGPAREDKWKTEGLTRKETTGKIPRTTVPMAGSAATTASEAAIQRQLKTLEEINRINEMNRQLMDQQRRMQNQR